MKEILVVFDNTMGIPGGEIDDGLALLYLLAFSDVHIRALCCTHGNSTTANTFEATQRLVAELGVDIPVIRGADAGDDSPSDAARAIVEASHSSNPISLLSLGAVTDLAAAERLEPGCLARFEHISFMGGITHTLRVGGKTMDELNFSVDGKAACEVFATARAGARLLVADAWNCVPLTFWTKDFIARLIQPAYAISPVLERYCLPWMEHAASAWNTDGFIGWDVLAAVALVHPDYVELQPFEVTENSTLFGVGLLERAQDPQLALPISLIVPRNPEDICEHIYAAWTTAASSLRAED